MWLILLTFLLISSASFAVMWLFMRSGRNQASDGPGPRGRRTLMFGALTPALAGMLPVTAENRLRYSRFLRQSGHYHAEAVTEFLALRNTLVVGSLLLVVATIVVATDPGDTAMFVVAVGGAIVIALLFAAPRLALESMAKNRTRRIEEGLPDAMDMVTMCMSAGLPLQHAISRVSSEMESSHPDLAFELRIVGRQTEAGSLNSAIQQFAKRMDIPEIHSIAAMVWQADQQGASVAGAFHAFSDQVRLNRRQRAEEAGNKTSIKMLFPLVFCLAPAVYLMLLGPAVMDLREFFRREKQPGGALSVSAQQMRSLTEPTAGPGTALPSEAPAVGPRIGPLAPGTTR